MLDLRLRMTSLCLLWEASLVGWSSLVPLKRYIFGCISMTTACRLEHGLNKIDLQFGFL